MVFCKEGPNLPAWAPSSLAPRALSIAPWTSAQDRDGARCDATPTERVTRLSMRKDTIRTLETQTSQCVASLIPVDPAESALCAAQSAFARFGTRIAMNSAHAIG